MKKIATLTPIDSTAARVVSKGEHYEWNRNKVEDENTLEPIWDNPPPFISTESLPKDRVLTGKKFGRLTVVGYLGPKLWCVKCTCGKYTRKISKTINRGHELSMCPECQNKEYLKRKASYLANGKRNIT